MVTLFMKPLYYCLIAGPLPLGVEPGPPAGFCAAGRAVVRGGRIGPGAPKAPVEVGLARLLLQGPLEVRTVCTCC